MNVKRGMLSIRYIFLVVTFFNGEYVYMYLWFCTYVVACFWKKIWPIRLRKKVDDDDDEEKVVLVRERKGQGREEEEEEGDKAFMRQSWSRILHEREREIFVMLEVRLARLGYVCQSNCI